MPKILSLHKKEITNGNDIVKMVTSKHFKTTSNKNDEIDSLAFIRSINKRATKVITLIIIAT